MTGPRPVVDDFAQWKAEQDFAKWKAEKSGADPNAALHAEFQRKDASGKSMLAGRMANETAEDQASVPSKLRAIPEAFETVAAGVPGVKLGISGARKLLNPSSKFGDIQREVNTETSPEAGGKLNALARAGDFFGKGAGALALAPALPASGAASGAILGGADQLLNNDPGSTAGGRIARGVGGAAAGGVVGKALDMASAGVRTLLAKGGEAAKASAIGERSDVATPWYQRVRATPPQPLTPEMTAMYGHEDIAPIAEKLLKLEQYKGKDVNDPDVIMAVRKSLSDWGHTLDKQGAVLDPGKANLVADLKTHVGLLKNAFDKAADTQVPGFSNAVKTFAEESIPISGQEAGYDAMRRKVAGNLTTFKNIGKKTPGALGDFLGRTTPEGAGGATEGVLAASKDLFKNGKRVSSLWNAPSLLQQTDKVSGQAAPNAIQKALLALLNAQANP